MEVTRPSRTGSGRARQKKKPTEELEGRGCSIPRRPEQRPRLDEESRTGLGGGVLLISVQSNAGAGKNLGEAGTSNRAGCQDFEQCVELQELRMQPVLSRLGL